jgi:hypothetical protein
VPAPDATLVGRLAAGLFELVDRLSLHGIRHEDIAGASGIGGATLLCAGRRGGEQERDHHGRAGQDSHDHAACEAEV